MTENNANDSKLAVIEQLFAAATDNASEAMCRWTSGQITLSLERMNEVGLENVPDALSIGDDLLTMVVLNLEGELGGQLILTFDDENGRHLAASLLGRDLNVAPEWNDLEKSALCETGNILGCAYMNTLTAVIETDLVPSPPYFIQDYGASVLQQAVMAQAMVSDRVLICSTVFRRESETLNWNIFFVPTEGLLNKLESSIKTVA